MSGEKPVTTIKKVTEKTVEWVMPIDIHIEAVLAHLRKNIPQFRGFEKDDIDFDFREDGSIHLKAWREKRE